MIGVFHGNIRPPSIAYFEVRKYTLAAEVLEDDTAYRPKVWR